MIYEKISRERVNGFLHAVGRTIQNGNNEEKKERSLHGQSIGRSDSGREQSAERHPRICTASQQLAHRYREKMAVVTPNQRECGCSTGFRPF